jgi:hypothetical protein
MQARRIQVAIGAVLAATVLLVVVVHLRSLQPVAPVGDVHASGPSLPVGQDQSLLSQVGVGPDDLGPGYTARLIDQGDQLSQATLDLCSLPFASERLRQARRQVAVSDSTGDAVLSTEAVLYRNQAGAAEAVAEARGAASRCPSGVVTSPDRTEPPLRWRIHADGDLGGARPASVDRVGLSVQTSEAGEPFDDEVVVFLRRGRLLLGLYFLAPDGPQVQVDGGSSIASTVATFEDRLAAVPAAELD